jgi:hypothetical protein
MMELLAKMIVAGGMLMIAGLCIFFCVKAEQLMREEAERMELRRQTENAMRYDRHLAKLKKQKMHVQYMRRARVW